MSKQLHHFINGAPVAGTSGRFGEVFNPATGELAARVPLAGTAEIDVVVAAARGAAAAWAEMTPLARARVLFQFRDLVNAHLDELAGLVTAEHGKTLADAKGSITRGLEVVEFACGIPHLMKGEFSESVGSGIDSWSLRQPVGVCAGITPFNFPAMVPMWMFPVALACGNTFILKPSEKDPSTGLRLAELLVEAGLPAGVFNVVNGDAEAVNALLEHRDVDAVSFVGSTPVAEHIYRSAAAHGKRVQALGGAKNHLVVMPDADLDQAADALVGAAYGSAGERCMAVLVGVAVGRGAIGVVDAGLARHGGAGLQFPIRAQLEAHIGDDLLDLRAGRRLPVRLDLARDGGRDRGLGACPDLRGGRAGFGAGGAVAGSGEEIGADARSASGPGSGLRRAVGSAGRRLGTARRGRRRCGRARTFRPAGRGARCRTRCRAFHWTGYGPLARSFDGPFHRSLDR